MNKLFKGSLKFLILYISTVLLMLSSVKQPYTKATLSSSKEVKITLTADKPIN